MRVLMRPDLTDAQSSSRRSRVERAVRSLDEDMVMVEK
jgi:hypothetical protein